MLMKGEAAKLYRVSMLMINIAKSTGIQGFDVNR